MTWELAVAECTVADCSTPTRTAGLCNKHYERWRRHGTTDLQPWKPRRAGVKRKRVTVQRPCQAEGCERGAARTYCPLHHQRMLLTGKLEASITVVRGTESEKFDHHTPERPADGCWVWAGKRHSVAGYGVLSSASPIVYAHRWSYEHHVGPIPAGLQIRHSCDNPPCVNPAHLSVGTAADNTADKVDRDRQAKGVDIANAKLDPDAVRAIRRKRSEGYPLAVLAAEYGVSTSTVCAAVRRRNWKHVQ